MSSPIYLLDTSFIIRLLTRDPLPLFERAAAFFDKWEKNMPGFVLTDLVLAEAYFALQHHYRYPKADALAALCSLVTQPAISVSGETLVAFSVSNLATAQPGFVDRLIHGHSQALGCTLVTFEKSTRRLPATMVLVE